MDKDSDLKKTIFSIQFIKNMHRQADEPRIWTQLAKLHIKAFLRVYKGGKCLTWNVCVVCIYTGHIFCLYIVQFIKEPTYT